MADDVILRNPVSAGVGTSRAQSDSQTSSKPEYNRGYRLGTADEDRAKIKEAAEALQSVRVPQVAEDIIAISSEDPEAQEEANLQKALELSLRETSGQVNNETPTSRRARRQDENTIDRDGDRDEEEEMRQALQLSLECVTGPPTPDPDDELRKALQLSLECVTAPTTPDPDELRRRRLAHLLAINSRTTNTESSTKLNT